MLFILALIISIGFSYNKVISIKELYKYITAILLLLISISLSYQDKIQIIRCIVLVGFIISVLAIYQYFFGFQHILDYIAKTKITDSFTLDYINRKRAFFPFVTPNTLGGYLAMIIPLAFSYKNKIWFIIPLSFALLLTKSLGALLSIFIGLGIYLYLQGKLKKRGILFLTGLLAMIVLVFILRQTATKEHILPTFSLAMRLDYWIDTLRIIKNSPWTGLGLGNFNLKVSRYAHNSYLQIWAEMGILGIISILWLIVMVFKSVLKNIKDSPNKQQISGLVTANAVFLVHNFIDFGFFLPEVSFTWWIILGLLTDFTL